MNLRSHKMIWVCIVCRKKQELLLKSGRWVDSGSGGDPVLNKIELDMALSNALTCSGAPCRTGSLGHSASISSLYSKAMPPSSLKHEDKSLTSKLRYPSGGHEREIRFSFDEPQPPDSTLDTISSLNKITHFPRYTDTKNVLLRQKSLNPDETIRTHSFLGQDETLSRSMLAPNKSTVTDSFSLFNPLSSSYNSSLLYHNKPSGYRDNIIDSLSAPEDHGRDECHRQEVSRIRYGSLQEAREKVAACNQQQRSMLDPDTKIRMSTTTRRKMDSTFRNDSLSSTSSPGLNLPTVSAMLPFLTFSMTAPRLLLGNILPPTTFIPSRIGPLPDESITWFFLRVMRPMECVFSEFGVHDT